MGKNIAIVILGLGVVGLGAYIAIDRSRRAKAPKGGAAPFDYGYSSNSTDALGAFIMNPLGAFTGML